MLNVSIWFDFQELWICAGPIVRVKCVHIRVRYPPICRFLVRELAVPALMYTFREGNSCADLLAGEGFHIQEG